MPERGPAIATAASTRGSARPSLEPDSRESNCRVRSVMPFSAGSPVTTLEARTGSVGHSAAPSSTAVPRPTPRAAADTAVVSSAIPAIATTRSTATGRTRDRAARNG
ncbi:hypothetical protein ADZ36_31785 [Streptomyces fradiae]|uniref:Uncharacterized protein n=1 Tax=Streptomyces fradiae TaxID=1906 RepID=A0ACC4W2G7_STRFR|nr:MULTISPECIES: hypothetical protein [Streptomyces]KNE78693.1 hypothetical protein ADZ36_31785 [Streptomyces fradiae]